MKDPSFPRPPDSRRVLQVPKLREVMSALFPPCLLTKVRCLSPKSVLCVFFFFFFPTARGEGEKGFPLLLG